MKFDTNKYMGISFTDRIRAVPIPNLAKFFIVDETADKDTAAVWIVKGLTGKESAIARQAVADSRNIEAVIESIGSGNFKDKVAAIKKIAGIMDEDDVPEDIVRRYSWLVQASVDPVCDYPLAIKIAENHPEEFYLLTNTILTLTSAGRVGE